MFTSWTIKKVQQASNQSASKTINQLIDRLINYKSMSADEELSNALGRRNDINEGKAAPQFNKKIPIATEFKEFSFKEIQSNYSDKEYFLICRAEALYIG